MKIQYFHVNDLKRDFTRQQIDEKIQSFQANDLEIIFQVIDMKTLYFHLTYKIKIF